MLGMQRYMRTHNRNWIHSETRNKWSSPSSGVIGSDFVIEKTSRAASFRIDFNMTMKLTEISASTESQRQLPAAAYVVA